MTFRFKNFEDARRAYAEDLPHLEARGIVNDMAQAYLLEPWKKNFQLAMDAQPGLSTTPSSGIPAWMTNYVDPTVYEIIFAPNNCAEVLGEEKKGDWTTQTAWFITVEHTGEVSSYGDWNENGSTGVNQVFPQRQAYLFQGIKEYGELQIARAGLAKIGYVAEVDKAQALTHAKFLNLTYAFGVGGLQNYGLTNDPGLNAALTPAPKGYGGNQWVVNGVVVATANEVFNDIQSLYGALISQSSGTIDAKSKMKLVLSPGSEVALTATNSFNVNVEDLLKKNFPNLTVQTVIQFGQKSTTNPQGIAAGNLAQLILDEVEGQKTGFCAFNEKMRSHAIVRGLSSFKQKTTSGTLGAVIRQPFGISQMLGI